ncbi:MAG: methionyl-tRNA formyltransferase [Rhodoferax sp.]|nr:methionyl-tRNA formyltransferase [Betaproteobacteria bacterium]NCN98149.1 methionyl-tRNA formyltransferase [Rhodoferax sp.]OIP16558.1 MAG: methionyl-tRNA formyltransferase [Comamonadaceae bacterium CG2_30_57_122]PIZ21972.1 MAG: methionyl-tRNA formyltransferase [Comamonadaceae bacterium CG_4_10_14_0_8_um_filter_57_29]PJC21336.1 MAG: methionyl-tRNA formyltransferase [Comamonadaceae bacterium CG_4_9_14_0_8_um_filter_57_21]
MKLIFAGTPEFAAVALAALHAAGHNIVLVLSQPDRPAGRGMKLQASAVKQVALQQGLAVAQPRSLRLDGKYPEDAAAAHQAIEAAQADAMVVAAYGLILPQWVLDTPRLGCFNIHASLLPRWRGAAPIHRAIEAGDPQTGVTIMQMDAGLDTGCMLRTGIEPILPTDTTGSLHDRLAELGAALMLQVLDLAAQGKLQPVPQPIEGISYAHKIDKAEAAIDWAQPAQTIVNQVRAFNPFPGSSTSLNGEVLKIWAAQLVQGAPGVSQTCGQIMALAHTGIAVAATESIVNITELQRPGGKRLSCADFLRGNALQVGQVLG